MVLTQTAQAFRAERGLLGREAWASAGELERNLGQGLGSLELGDVTVSPPAVGQTSGSCDPGSICSVGMASLPQGPWLLGENVGRVRVSGAPRVQSARSRDQVTASGRGWCVWQHQCCPRCGRRRRRPAHTPALWPLSRRRGGRCSGRHRPRERAFLAGTRNNLWDSALAGHPQHHGPQCSVPSRKQCPENVPEAWAVGHQEIAGGRTCSRPWLAARGPKGERGPEKQRLGLLWAQGSLAGEGR